MKLPFILARRFVAAESLEGALPVVKSLNVKGLSVALDLLGEYVSDRAVATEALNNYVDLVHRIARDRLNENLKTNISIKLSMLGQKIDRSFCVDNLHRLLEVARQDNVFVRLDMEGSDITESTISIFEEVRPTYPEHVGIVLQAYLKRTAEDVRRMCEMKARVRLCKGAYQEPPEIAYQRMGEIRERFVEYMKMLIKEAPYPGIATHDDRLIDATKQFVVQEGIPSDRFEFQMLYGLRPEKQVKLRGEGYNMRVYVPYGTEWLPYFTRRLRERKENIWFVAKNLVRG